MPVLQKTKHKRMTGELKERFSNLIDAFECRELKHSSEGVKGHGCWTNPDVLCATAGDNMELRLAVEDFKTILDEIKRLK